MDNRIPKENSETDWAQVDSMTDEEIDTSDIPPLDEEFFKKSVVRTPDEWGTRKTSGEPES